jgi:phosphoenolpyruvate carboxylase
VLDLRQNSDVHEAVIAELLARAGAGRRYKSLAEPARIALLAAELESPRLLHSPHLTYSDLARSERAVLEVAADIHRRFGAAALPNYVISKCQSVSDLLEVAVLLKEVGLLRGNALAVNIVPLFETIDDLERSPAIMRAAFALPFYRPLDRRPRRMAGGDARLFRQQQGRRVSHRQLVALSRRAGARRCVPRARRQAAVLSRPRRHRRARRRAELRGHPRAAGRAASAADCASPSRARSSPASTPIRTSAGAILETLVAATLEASMLDSERLEERAREFYGALDALSRHAHTAYRALVYGTPGFVDYFRACDTDRGARGAQHRQPARVADVVDADRGPPRHSMGVQLGAMPADAPGLVRLRARRRHVARRASGGADKGLAL